MKKKLIPFLTVLFLASGCYIYKPYTEDSSASAAESKISMSNSIRDRKSDGSGTASLGTAGSTSPKQKTSKPVSKDNGPTDAEMKKKQEEALKKIADPEERKLRTEEFRMMNEKREMQQAATGKTIPDDVKVSPADGTVASPEGTEVPAGLKSKIQPNKYYMITVADKQYKIQADQWEGDTLVAHKLRKPKKVLKFHQNQIDEESLLERRFSKSYSDLITVGSYVAAGAAVLLLIL